MDWRIRNLLIAYILYYIVVLRNLIDCLILWYLLGLIGSVIIADVVESYELGRTSQIAAIIRGEDPRHAHDDHTRERVSHLDKIKKAAFS